jgi:hypothetical protein
MHQIARKTDFDALSPDQQKKAGQLLFLLNMQRQSCRCEMNGRDFSVVVAVGLSSPQYWADRFDIDLQEFA